MSSEAGKDLTRSGLDMFLGTSLSSQVELRKHERNSEWRPGFELGAFRMEIYSTTATHRAPTNRWDDNITTVCSKVSGL